MKAELLEANHIYYVVITHANSRTKSLIDFNGHLTLATQFAALVNKACSACGGLAGMHTGVTILNTDTSFSASTYKSIPCPNENVVS